MRKCIKDKRKKIAKDVRRMIKQNDGKIMLVIPGKIDIDDKKEGVEHENH